MKPGKLKQVLVAIVAFVILFAMLLGPDLPLAARFVVLFYILVFIALFLFGDDEDSPFIP
jgi:hypothetical protein